MAFLKTGLKAMGGEGFPDDEGKMFCYTSPTDTLTQMKVSGYFNSISNKLDTVYLIVARGTNGIELMTLNVDSTGLILTFDTRTQSISGPGAVDIINAVTEMTTTGADAFTLADGTVGQKKIVILIVDGGNAILTPANGLGYTIITFADAGDSAVLEFRSGGWAILGVGGIGIGPVPS